MWIILILVGIRPKNMSPVCRALSLFGFALWLMPYVSPGWGFTVTGAYILRKKPISHESRSDECDIAFQVKFTVEFTS